MADALESMEEQSADYRDPRLSRRIIVIPKTAATTNMLADTGSGTAAKELLACCQLNKTRLSDSRPTIAGR